MFEVILSVSALFAEWLYTVPVPERIPGLSSSKIKVKLEAYTVAVHGCSITLENGWNDMRVKTVDPPQVTPGTHLSTNPKGIDEQLDRLCAAAQERNQTQAWDLLPGMLITSLPVIILQCQWIGPSIALKV